MATSQRPSTPDIHRAIWLAATDYIDGHVATPLTVADVARAAVTSERQLQRVFAALGATTVRGYIGAARMRRAATLVVESDSSMAAIGMQVGYRHASAFVKAFRTHHGLTPGVLRRGAAM